MQFNLWSEKVGAEAGFHIPTHQAQGHYCLLIELSSFFSLSSFLSSFHTIFIFILVKSRWSYFQLEDFLKGYEEQEASVWIDLGHEGEYFLQLILKFSWLGAVYMPALCS